MLRNRPTQIKGDSRRDEGGRLRINPWVCSLLLLTSLACTAVITNEEYEFTQNNVSRELKLLDPSLLENVVRELREVFNG